MSLNTLDVKRKRIIIIIIIIRNPRNEKLMFSTLYYVYSGRYNQVDRVSQSCSKNGESRLLSRF